MRCEIYLSYLYPTYLPALVYLDRLFTKFHLPAFVFPGTKFNPQDMRKISFFPFWQAVKEISLYSLALITADCHGEPHI